jgi:hypothetical protein
MMVNLGKKLKLLKEKIKIPISQFGVGFYGNTISILHRTFKIKKLKTK